MPEETQYQQMWQRLIREVDFLIAQDVESIHPILLRGYMDFIQDVVSLSEENKTKERR